MIDSTFQPEGINVSREGLELIKTWEHAKFRASQAQNALNQANKELTDAKNRLAKWMLPHDAKPGERFGVWVGNDLIQVEAAGSSPNDDHIITVRQRTK